MKQTIVITPIKDSLSTVKEVIQTFKGGDCPFRYYLFDDFSSKETRRWLEEHKEKYGYEVIGLEMHTRKKPPNYRTTLILGQQIALESDAHLAIVESDVFASPDIIKGLTKLAETKSNAGLVGSVTIDQEGEINFPYLYAADIEKPDTFATNKSISFCCTVLSNSFLKKFDFNDLPLNLDWFDIFISRKSRQLGFSNYVSKKFSVLHKPHSSRPWKHLKYSNPILYYLIKIIRRRDRI